MSDRRDSQWRDVTGYDGKYQVSSDGYIRNRDGRVLKPWLAGAGYLSVVLYGNGKKRKHYVAHLVAREFLGPMELGRKRGDMQVNHRDGVKRNNAVSNLEYVDTSGNHKHAALIGLSASGERNGRAKLTVGQAREIRSSSESAKVLHGRYGVSLDLIYQIRRGDLWARAA